MKISYYIVSKHDIIPANRIYGKSHAIDIAKEIAFRDGSWASVHEVGILDNKEQYDKCIVKTEWNQKNEMVETTIRKI